MIDYDKQRVKAHTQHLETQKQMKVQIFYRSRYRSIRDMEIVGVMSSYDGNFIT